MAGRRWSCFNKRGASTVFLLIISLAIIALGLTLIDLTRIIVAENRVKRAVELAGSSLLACYDGRMSEEYGLFGENSGSEARTSIFLSYLKRNLPSDESKLALRYRINTETTKVEVLHSLADDKALKAQMIDCVKYKAPGQWLKRVKETFRPSLVGELRTKNMEARNGREKKKEMKRKLAELKVQLKDAQGAGKEALLSEIRELAGLLEESDGEMKGKSNSVPRETGGYMIADLLKEKVESITGLANKRIPKEAYPSQYESRPGAGLMGLGRDLGTDEEREASSDRALRTLVEFAESVRRVADGSVDKLFMGEYVIERFSSLINERKGHYLRRGEVEFILEGDRGMTELAAISMVLTKLWMLRFAVHALVNIANSLIPEPFERLAYALMTAGIEASTDTMRLIAGHKVEAVPKMGESLKLGYEDYLKLFLYGRADSELLDGTRLMINATALEMGSPKLEEAASWFRIQYEVGVNLLFIPLFKPELVSDRFKEGAFLIRGEECMGY